MNPDNNGENGHDQTPKYDPDFTSILKSNKQADDLHDVFVLSGLFNSEKANSYLDALEAEKEAMIRAENKSYQHHAKRVS